jgi:hypothetical protein
VNAFDDSGKLGYRDGIVADVSRNNRRGKIEELPSGSGRRICHENSQQCSRNQLEPNGKLFASQALASAILVQKSFDGQTAESFTPRFCEWTEDMGDVLVLDFIEKLDQISAGDATWSS